MSILSCLPCPSCPKHLWSWSRCCTNAICFDVCTNASTCIGSRRKQPCMCFTFCLEWCIISWCHCPCTAWVKPRQQPHQRCPPRQRPPPPQHCCTWRGTAWGWGCTYMAVTNNPKRISCCGSSAHPNLPLPDRTQAEDHTISFRTADCFTTCRRPIIRVKS